MNEENTPQESPAEFKQDTEILESITRLFDEKIRPAVQRDGGDIEFVEFVDGIVKVRLRGACRSCASSAITLHQGVERMLKEAFPAVLGIEQVA